MDKKERRVYQTSRQESKKKGLFCEDCEQCLFNEEATNPKKEKKKI